MSRVAITLAGLALVAACSSDSESPGEDGLVITCEETSGFPVDCAGDVRAPAADYCATNPRDAPLTLMLNHDDPPPEIQGYFPPDLGPLPFVCDDVDRVAIILSNDFGGEEG